MKPTALFAAVLALGMPAIAQAQDMTTPAPGRQVFDPRGDYIATIVSIDSAANTAVVDTGSRRGTVQLNMFGRSNLGPTLVTTRSQLDSLIAQAIAREDAAISAAVIAQAAVLDSNSAVLGTITELTPEGLALIEGEAGSFYLPRSAFYLFNGQLQAMITTASVIGQLAAQ